MPLWLSGETRQWHTIMRSLQSLLSRQDQPVPPYDAVAMDDRPGVTTLAATTFDALNSVQQQHGRPHARAKAYSASQQYFLERLTSERERSRLSAAD